MKISRRGIGLIVLGVVCYLAFLVVKLPAARVFALLGEQLPVQAFGVGGTVWNGNAAVMLAGPVRIEAVQWRLSPMSIIQGKFGATVQARMPGEGRLQGWVEASADSLRAEDLKLNMPVNQLLQWSALSTPFPLDGRLDVLLKSLRMDEGRFVRADGMLSWQNAAAQLGNRRVPLGEVALRLVPNEAGGINGTLVSQGGAVLADAKLQLDADTKLAIDGNARMSPEVDTETQQALALLGLPPDGSPLQLKLTGNFDAGGYRMGQ